MNVAVTETMTYEEVLALALPPSEQLKLILALGARLPLSTQARLIMQMLPAVAPTIEAAIRGETLPITGGGTTEDALALLESWLAEPALDEDAETWDEIMRNLGAYGPPDAAA